MNKLLTVFYKIRHSLWFIPFILMILSVIIFHLLNFANSHFIINDFISYKDWFGLVGSSADDLASVAINIVVTIFALSISLIMIVLTLVSGQVGPRIIDYFLGSKVTQFVVGFYLASILFLMFLNAKIGSEMPVDELPFLAIVFGVFLVVLSPILMVFFVQHLASSIVPNNVIEPLSASLSQSVERYLKSNIQHDMLDRDRLNDAVHVVLRAKTSGYLSNIQEEILVACLEEKGAILEFLHMPGRFIIQDAVIGKAYTKDKKLNEKETELIQSYIEFSSHIPVVEDVNFFLRAIVEIALRALSPSMNDPYTAHACLNYMFTSLQPIALSDENAEGGYCDSKGKVRLFLPLFSLEGMYDLALNQVQEASKSMIGTQIYILELLIITLSSPINMRAKKHLIMHAKEIIRCVEDGNCYQPYATHLDDLKENLKLQCEKSGLPKYFED